MFELWAMQPIVGFLHFVAVHIVVHLLHALVYLSQFFSWVQRSIS